MQFTVKKVLDLRRSIACLAGISNKDNVFRHGPWKNVVRISIDICMHTSIYNSSVCIVGQCMCGHMEGKTFLFSI